MKFGDELLDLEGREVALARAISRITPAPLFNLYVGLIFISLSPIGLGPNLDVFSSIVLCLIFMVILPVTPIIFEAWRGNVDLDVSARSLRGRFFVLAIVCYALSYIVFWFFQCDIMRILSAAYFTVTTGVMIATNITKVSVHAAGVGGPGTALVYVFGLVASPVILVWIAVVWSRKTLQQHTYVQGILGVLMGIIITWPTYFLLY